MSKPSKCSSGKFRYRRQLAAENSATEMTKKNLRKPTKEDRTACRAYACACGGWHITSEPWSPVYIKQVATFEYQPWRAFLFAEIFQ